MPYSHNGRAAATTSLSGLNENALVRRLPFEVRTAVEDAHPGLHALTPRCGTTQPVVERARADHDDLETRSGCPRSHERRERVPLRRRADRCVFNDSGAVNDLQRVAGMGMEIGTRCR
jgi:hypothetical protein